MVFADLDTLTDEKLARVREFVKQHARRCNTTETPVSTSQRRNSPPSHTTGCHSQTRQQRKLTKVDYLSSKMKRELDCPQRTSRSLLWYGIGDRRGQVSAMGGGGTHG